MAIDPRPQVPTPATTASPCVRSCCLDDDDICLGCYRSLAEITGWNAMNETDKQACLARCAARRAADSERYRHW